ncbi:MAG TPA: sugar-binding protein, partial [Cytophagales bacterium]|nr:sugar-binding protein [Cytophagales bacterium]
PNTSIAGITVYYVSQTLNGCEGPRAEISVTVTNTYKIYKTATAPIIDGTVEAIWNSAEVLSVDATKSIVGTVSGAGNLSASAKYLWDNSYLYVLATVTDDTKQNDSPNAYEDDAVEFYFDINNDKATAYAANDVQYTFGWNDGSIVGSLPSGRATTGITYSSVNTTSGYIIEARIPWTTLQGIPTADQSIGIDFMVNDDDDGTGRDRKLSWNAAEDNAWQNPSLFGTGILVDAIVTDLQDVMLSELHIYPNPVRGFIQIQGLEGSVEYSIVDHSGRTLQAGSTESLIQVSHLESGLYGLIIPYKGTKKVVKIVVGD